MDRFEEAALHDNMTRHSGCVSNILTQRANRAIQKFFNIPIDHYDASGTLVNNNNKYTKSFSLWWWMKQWHVQPDQINMAELFWCLVKSGLSNVHATAFTNKHWTNNFTRYQKHMAMYNWSPCIVNIQPKWKIIKYKYVFIFVYSIDHIFNRILRSSILVSV